MVIGVIEYYLFYRFYLFYLNDTCSSALASNFFLGGGIIKNVISLVCFLMPNFLDIGKNTSCTILEAFDKVCLQLEGVYVDSSTYAHGPSLSD